MSEDDKIYDQKSVSDSFLWAATEAERYLNEVRGKLKRTRSYEHVFDDHLAKFYVYNYLHGRTFLESQASFLAELRSIKGAPFPAPSEAFDAQWFERCRQSYLAALIERFETTPNPESS